jgi:hypothetical protein
VHQRSFHSFTFFYIALAENKLYQIDGLVVESTLLLKWKSMLITKLKSSYSTSITVCELQLQGFAELEYGMLRYMGAIDDSTMIVTTGEFSVLIFLVACF